MEKARGEGGKFITAGQKKRMERMKTVGQGEKQNMQDNNIENNEGVVKWCEGRDPSFFGFETCQFPTFWEYIPNNYPCIRTMALYPKQCGNVRFVGRVVNDFR